MSSLSDRIARNWMRLGPRYLPFADAASDQLPLGRLLRLSLFQVSVGMALVLLTGTLNRVMIVELGVPAGLVATMVALPVLFAPFRALIGFRSDTHRSALGWRRVPFIWFGTLLQFGGLAIMPFALLVLSADQLHGPEEVRYIGAALAFLLVGAGLHTTQTAGLALATDLAPAESRPRVVALLYVMLLLGMVASAFIFGMLLGDFDPGRLIQIIQAAAVVTVLLNIVALWKQEVRAPERTRKDLPRPSFTEAWRDIQDGGRTKRLLIAVFLGTAGFCMQDILLEPYGGEVLGLNVGATTLLTAILAGGSLFGFALAARALTRGTDPFRLAALGCLTGIFAFAAVIFAAPLESAGLFRVGTAMIGFGGGLLAVGTLTAAMAIADSERSGNGLALGAWGAVQATAAGGGIALGGLLRDLVSELAAAGHLGAGLSSPDIGYSVVYHLEILLLFAALVAIGPLVRSRASADWQASGQRPGRFGLADMPG